jgi:hypothetical protein
MNDKGYSSNLKRIFPEEKGHDERDTEIDDEAVRNEENGKYDPDK